MSTLLAPSTKIKEKFNLLEKEFQLSNYKMWLTVASVLKLNSDKMLVHTVYNAVGDALGKLSEEQQDMNWHLRYRMTRFEPQILCFESAQSEF